MEWIVLEGGSNPISPFVCLSTLLSLASERHFWLYDYETVNATKHKKKEKKSSDGLLTIKMTCAKLLYFLLIMTVYVMFE
jgi:hypothetical protein